LSVAKNGYGVAAVADDVCEFFQCHNAAIKTRRWDNRGGRQEM
jgi:hypothetical protein